MIEPTKPTSRRLIQNENKVAVPVQRTINEELTSRCREVAQAICGADETRYRGEGTQDTECT